MKKISYVLAGASFRCFSMFAQPIYEQYQDYIEITGIFDVNRGHSEYISERCGSIKVYDNFDEMIKTETPDVVLVTTVDAYHSDYIIRALELGCDVITEKPMTIDATRCKAILDAEQKYGKKVTVTFNYRYAPYMTKIKEIIKSGAIGNVYSVHFEWLLDRNMEFGAHGTSYFRRWNSHMEKSGGLLVHKSTHHFDLVNWWLDAEPEKVSAFGKLNLYGKNGMIRGTNCRSCDHTEECNFRYQFNDFERDFFAKNEHYDGYFKDGCVYAEDIDIYDTMSVIVLYVGGQMMSYSLNATTPYEGWRVSINGSLGRLEAFSPETGFQANERLSNEIKVFTLDNNVTEYYVTKTIGGHGGGDSRLHEMLFRGIGDKSLGYEAGTKAGANSILIGIAANISIRDGRLVKIDELSR